eukprot:scaffold29709_cov53-Attheya_sp.AAC.1
MLRSIFSAARSVIDLTSSERKEESTSSSSSSYAGRTRQLSTQPSLAVSTSASSLTSSVEVIEPDNVGKSVESR